MTRSLPIRRPPPRHARVWFDPNGSHMLEVSLAGGDLYLSHDDIDWLRRAFGAFESVAIWEDGRDAVVQRRHAKPLEVY